MLCDFIEVRSKKQGCQLSTIDYQKKAEGFSYLGQHSAGGRKNTEVGRLKLEEGLLSYQLSTLDYQLSTINY